MIFKDIKWRDNGYMTEQEKALRKEAIKDMKTNLSCIEVATNIFGMSMMRSRSNQRYLKPVEHSSMVFDLKNNVVWWNAKTADKALNVIDFFCIYENISSFDAINKLLDYYYSRNPNQIETIRYDPKKDRAFYADGMVMPKRNENNNMVVHYLVNQRKLDIDIVNDLINKNMLFEDIYHNAVFVSKDIIDNNKFSFGVRRSTTHKLSKDCYGTFKHNGFYYEVSPTASKLVVTEAVIDGLSFASLNKEKEANILSCSGSATVLKTLKYNLINNPSLRNIKNIVLMLDNDKAGFLARDRIIEEFENNEMITYNNGETIEEIENNFLIEIKDCSLERNGKIYNCKDVNELLQAKVYFEENDRLKEIQQSHSIEDDGLEL